MVLSDPARQAEGMEVSGLFGERRVGRLYGFGSIFGRQVFEYCLWGRVRREEPRRDSLRLGVGRPSRLVLGRGRAGRLSLLECTAIGSCVSPRKPALQFLPFCRPVRVFQRSIPIVNGGSLRWRRGSLVAAVLSPLRALLGSNAVSPATSCELDLGFERRIAYLEIEKHSIIRHCVGPGG